LNTTRLTIDPELDSLLKAIPAEARPPFHKRIDDIPAVRRTIDTMFAAGKPHLDMSGITSKTVEVPGGSDSAPIRLRVLRPDTNNILPCIYWIHGGGMIMGSFDQDDAALAEMVRELDCVTVSVEYRLAPEHPHPAPLHDCYAGLLWTEAHASLIGVDQTRIAIAGMSAGGGLAAATALMARDCGGPKLKLQLLIYPMLDDRNITPSSHEVFGVGMWEREANISGWTALLGDSAGGADVEYFAAPARARILRDLPPAFIDVGALDIYRDECIDYASRLLRDGVNTELHVYAGAFHGWDAFAPGATISKAAVSARHAALRKTFLKS
jgi:acetyl esterase/lipase